MSFEKPEELFLKAASRNYRKAKAQAVFKEKGGKTKYLLSSLLELYKHCF